MTIIDVIALILLIVGVIALATGLLARDMYRAVIGGVLLIVALWLNSGGTT